MFPSNVTDMFSKFLRFCLALDYTLRVFREFLIAMFQVVFKTGNIVDGKLSFMVNVRKPGFAFPMSVCEAFRALTF